MTDDSEGKSRSGGEAASSAAPHNGDGPVENLKNLAGDTINNIVGAVMHTDLAKKYADAVSGPLARQYVRGRTIAGARQSEGRDEEDYSGLSKEDSEALRAYRKVHDELPAKIPFVDRDALVRAVDRNIEIKARVIPPPTPTPTSTPTPTRTKSEAMPPPPAKASSSKSDQGHSRQPAIPPNTAATPPVAAAPSPVKKEIQRPAQSSQTSQTAQPAPKDGISKVPQMAPPAAQSRDKSLVQESAERSSASAASPRTSPRQDLKSDQSIRQIKEPAAADRDNSELPRNISRTGDPPAKSAPPAPHEPLSPTLKTRLPVEKLPPRDRAPSPPNQPARSGRLPIEFNATVRRSGAAVPEKQEEQAFVSVRRRESTTLRLVAELQVIPLGRRFSQSEKFLSIGPVQRKYDQADAPRLQSPGKATSNEVSLRKTGLQEIRTQENKLQANDTSSGRHTLSQHLSGTQDVDISGRSNAPVPVNPVNRQLTGIAVVQVEHGHEHAESGVERRDQSVSVQSDNISSRVVEHGISSQIDHNAGRHADSGVKQEAENQTVKHAANAPIQLIEVEHSSGEMGAEQAHGDLAGSAGKAPSSHESKPDNIANSEEDSSKTNEGFDSREGKPDAKPDVNQKGRETYVVRGLNPDKRYITGGELAFVAIMALAGASRIRPGVNAAEYGLEQVRREYVMVEEEPWFGPDYIFPEPAITENTVRPQPSKSTSDVPAVREDNTALDDDKKETRDAAPKRHVPGGRVLMRPQILVEEDDDLCDLAEVLFNDNRHGHLIADLNMRTTEQKFLDNKRIIRLKTRQRLSLPVWEDVQYFETNRMSQIGKIPLITIVERSAIDRELLDEGLSKMLGIRSKNIDPLQKKKIEETS